MWLKIKSKCVVNYLTTNIKYVVKNQIKICGKLSQSELNAIWINYKANLMHLWLSKANLMQSGRPKANLMHLWLSLTLDLTGSQLFCSLGIISKRI